MSQASAPHPERKAAHAKDAFIELRPNDVAARQAQIDALPIVAWKGRTLRTLRCHGTSGKGPHNTNVPESLLWSLIDFRAFRCPFHANDEIGPTSQPVDEGRTHPAIGKSVDVSLTIGSAP